MSLSLSPVFHATRVSAEIVSIPSIVKVGAQWTPEQMGDGPNGERLVSSQFRVRRWVNAWQTTAIAYGLPKWSRYVPCHVCKGAVDVYYSDCDHLVSRENGGQSTNANMAIVHAGCNRQTKNYKNATADIINAFRAASRSTVSYKGMPNVKGGPAARAFAEWYRAYPRREN